MQLSMCMPTHRLLLHLGLQALRNLLHLRCQAVRNAAQLLCLSAAGGSVCLGL